MSCEPDSSTATDPTEEQPCPGCGATHGVQPKSAPPKVQAWTCTACGLHFVVTVVNAHLSWQPPRPARNDIGRSILGLLPPEQRTAALLAVLRTEVIQRSGKEKDHTMTVTVCFPVDQVVPVRCHGHGRYDRMVVPDLRAGRYRENNTAGDQRRRCAPGQ